MPFWPKGTVNGIILFPIFLFLIADLGKRICRTFFRLSPSLDRPCRISIFGKDFFLLWTLKDRPVTSEVGEKELTSTDVWRVRTDFHVPYRGLCISLALSKVWEKRRGKHPRGETATTTRKLVAKVGWNFGGTLLGHATTTALLPACLPANQVTTAW